MPLGREIATGAAQGQQDAVPPALAGVKVGCRLAVPPGVVATDGGGEGGVV